MVKLCVLFAISFLQFVRAEGIASDEYTIAPRLSDSPEFTYEEVSRSWRRTTRDNVKFVRLPTSNASRTQGPCGTTHYVPDHLALTPQQLDAYKAGKGPGSGIQNQQEVGSYLTETAACRFLDVMQEWTRECEVLNKDKNVCAIGWGDGSHRDTLEFKPHSAKHHYHGYGQCLDIRPIRKGNLEMFKLEHANDPFLKDHLKKGEYNQWPISHIDDYYDREKTYKLLMLLKEKGAKPIFFLDPEMRKYAKKNKLPAPEYKDAKGHANHIHACFPSNKANQEACKSFRYKRAACGSPLY